MLACNFSAVFAGDLPYRGWGCRGRGFWFLWRKVFFRLSEPKGQSLSPDTSKSWKHSSHIQSSLPYSIGLGISSHGFIFLLHLIQCTISCVSSDSHIPQFRIFYLPYTWLRSNLSFQCYYCPMTGWSIYYHKHCMIYWTGIFVRVLRFDMLHIS